MQTGGGQVHTLLLRWIESPTAEAPILLTGDHTDAEKIRGDIEGRLQKKSFMLEVLQIDDFAKEEQKKTDSIAVYQIREVFRVIHQTSPHGKRLIYFPRIERLTAPAVHMLLKHLEEPSLVNRFLLTTLYPRRLLATVRSRVQIVALPSSVASEETQPVQLDIQALLKKRSKTGFSQQEIQQIHGWLEGQVHKNPSDPGTYRCLLRLRDYYKIAALKGNVQLARDVLLASLLEIADSRR